MGASIGSDRFFSLNRYLNGKGKKQQTCNISHRLIDLINLVFENRTARFIKRSFHHKIYCEFHAWFNYKIYQARQRTFIVGAC
jgi:predicted methyltransferase